MTITAPPLHYGKPAWWLAEMGSRSKTLPAHRDCIHRRYRLTCAQFEDLVDASGGRCGGCGVEAVSLVHGHMHGRHQALLIDHDHGLGPWAVRGLLCYRCNSVMDRWMPVERVMVYNASAFYLRLLAAAGVDLRGPTEPEIGTSVVDFAYRQWQRTKDGWVAQHAMAWHFPKPVSWRFLVDEYGPHNLRLAAEAA